MDFEISGQCQTERSHPARLPIGLRLRQLREQRGLSQADIEQKAGLVRCYISRVENGCKLPSLRTLERFAFALDVPLYRLFYDGNRLRLVSWSTPRAVYWVSNTLSKTLTNRQMLAIARSLSRFGGR